MSSYDPVPHVRASGTITINWRDFGDDDGEPRVAWDLQTEPALHRGNIPQFVRLLRDVAARQEAALRTDLFDH